MLVNSCTLNTQEEPVHECKATIKNRNQPACRMSDEAEDKDSDGVPIALPLRSLAAITDAEEKLKIPKNAQAMVIGQQIM